VGEVRVPEIALTPDCGRASGRTRGAMM